MQEKGVFQQEVQSVSMNEKMMSDPSMMTGMMKKQLTGTAPHLVMGFLVNQFFAGFVMGKLPFTLSPRFKVMLQRGVDMSSLDVSYFTSLSFYILLLFGLKGILSLMFSADTIDESAVMKQSMAGASPVFDAKAEFNGEKQRFDLVCSYSMHLCPPDIQIASLLYTTICVRLRRWVVTASRCAGNVRLCRALVYIGYAASWYCFSAVWRSMCCSSAAQLHTHW
jgi:hypothetical protein